MKQKTLGTIAALLCVAFCAAGADAPRNWKSGTLMETEKQQVLQGSTTRTNTESSVKDKDKKKDYSRNSTSTTTDNYDTFQVYTIQGEDKTYIARERLMFPWSKPANVAVGGKVKYDVQKNTMFLLDDDGKQHKAGISKVSMNPAH